MWILKCTLKKKNKVYSTEKVIVRTKIEVLQESRTECPYLIWIIYEVSTTNCGKFSKRWAYQTTWPAFWDICMQVKKQQLELDMEQ